MATLKALANVARILFGLAILGFATQYLIYATRHVGPIPGPPWTPGNTLLAYPLAIFLFLTGAAIVANKASRFAAAMLNAFFLLRFAFIHLPQLMRHLHEPGPWTTSFEVLALAGGAMVIAGLSEADLALTSVSNREPRLGARMGAYFFAILLVVVGVQHFMYAEFVSRLIPGWIPARLFFAYLVGAGFFATALSIFTRTLTRLAVILQGIVFVIFVVAVHIPRVAAAPRDGNGLTSLFIAIAMVGTSFAVAAVTPKSR